MRVRSEADSIALVASGNVNAAASGRSAFRLISSQRAELAEIPNSAFQSASLAPALRKDDFVFRDWFNEVGIEMKKNGELLAIMKKYGLDESFVPV